MSAKANRRVLIQDMEEVGKGEEGKGGGEEEGIWYSIVHPEGWAYRD